MAETTFVGIPASISNQAHTLGTEWAFRLATVLILILIVPLALGPDRVLPWIARLRGRPPGGPAPIAPHVAARRATLNAGTGVGYPDYLPSQWLTTYHQANKEITCAIFGQPKQMLRECEVTDPIGVVRVARVALGEPSTQFSLRYPTEFIGADDLDPLADGEYQIRWVAVGGAVIRSDSFALRRGLFTKEPGS